MSATTVKTTSKNYNEDQEKYLTEHYVKKANDTETLTKLAMGVNKLKWKGQSDKNANSIRQKLKSMDLFEASDEQRKVGNADSTRKIHFIYQLEALLGFEKGELVSLEKGNKPALEATVSKVANVTFSRDKALEKLEEYESRFGIIQDEDEHKEGELPEE